MDDRLAEELADALEFYQELKAAPAPAGRITEARRRYEILAGEVNAAAIRATLIEKESLTDG